MAILGELVNSDECAHGLFLWSFIFFEDDHVVEADDDCEVDPSLHSFATHISSKEFQPRWAAAATAAAAAAA